MIDVLALLSKSGGDAAISVASMMAFEDALDLLLDLLFEIRRLRDFLLIVESATRQACKLEQAC